MIVHGSPKLKKKIEEIQLRINELNALKVEGIDQQQEAPELDIFTDIEILEEYYQNQIQNNIVDLLRDNGDEMSAR